MVWEGSTSSLFDQGLSIFVVGEAALVTDLIRNCLLYTSDAADE